MGHSYQIKRNGIRRLPNCIGFEALGHYEDSDASWSLGKLVNVDQDTMIVISTRHLFGLCISLN
jgi:hypothetical protein